MLGAIYGDIIGSYYETHCTKNYDFELQRDSSFTDDTVLTVATARAVLNNPEPVTRFKLRKRGFEYAALYRQYYSYYPSAGFGIMFSEWARGDVHKINRSYGNGAAIIAFLESDDYESAVRKAVSLGGDADTEACIAGGIAEAYYGEIPKYIADFCDRKLDGFLKSTVKEFQKRFCR